MIPNDIHQSFLQQKTGIDTEIHSQKMVRELETLKQSVLHGKSL